MTIEWNAIPMQDAYQIRLKLQGGFASFALRDAAYAAIEGTVNQALLSAGSIVELDLLEWTIRGL